MAGNTSEKKPIEQYEHKGKTRCNNPPAGIANAEKEEPKAKKYDYDPHLDPQLWWSGKMGHMSFEVPTVSLHVHERIDPLTIIRATRRRDVVESRQMSLFDYKEENPPIREAVEFYKHKHNWSNRLVARDSLLVMNSLLQKEGMAGKVQMIYIDPPYGIKYGSNFQPFVNKKEVKDGSDDDLSQEPESIKAFRDTWELGIHSYLTYLRDRLLLAHDLLHESGSVFVQISSENLHLVRNLFDEVFGVNNFISVIPFVTTSSQTSLFLPTVCDFIIWYCKDKTKIKYRPLYVSKEMGGSGSSKYTRVLMPDGTKITLVDALKKYKDKLPEGAKLYRIDTLTSQSGGQNSTFPVEFNGEIVKPRTGFWKTNSEGMKRLIQKGRIEREGRSIGYIRFMDDFPAFPLGNVWTDYASIQSRSDPKIYAVQTATKVIRRCMLMTTDPSDLVFDPTCGSGTTAYVAENWGRRWITCDTSRVAITLAKQRLMTALFEYYVLAYPGEGVGSGFRYKTVPHITLKSIATNEPAAQEILYDQPIIDNSRVRVTGPFTVEAVPAPTVKPISELVEIQHPDESIARSGETLRQDEWRSELINTGIRGKSGQKIEFSRVETMAGTKWIHADAETKETNPQRVVISFGPVHAPLESKQVELAIREAQKLVPQPKMIVFASFQFDPEAAKDIDETKWPNVTLLKVQMNTDLLTEDLKKKRSSNESFLLIGQPDVDLEKVEGGKYRVTIHGFDYYNTKTGIIESGGPEKVAMWMLDPDYDGRSLFPCQVFFPMSGDKDGWSKLAKNLKADIDEDLIEAYRGTVSLPFKSGDHNRVAIKIVDDRGIESLKVMDVA